MGVRSTALVDDGYQSGILAEGLVRELCGPRTGLPTGAAPGVFRIFLNRIASRATRKTHEKLTKPMTRTLQKNIRVTPGQWNRIENAAAERDVSANRLVVELAMEALDRREWPRTDLEIQLLRSSVFTAQAIARDMIAARREDEVEEIRRNISATTVELLD